MFRSSGSSAHVLPFFWHAIFLAALLLAAMVAPASAQEKPKIRTITAFIRLDPAQYQQQIADTLTMLRNAKARFGLAGYEVQTIRITTQPFTEYTHGMSKDAALAFFHDLDALAKQEDVSISIGPALMDEKDDPAQARTARRNFGAIHQLVWQRGGGRTGRRPLERRSRGGGNYEISRGSRATSGLGNFRFAAIANVPAYTPFYPASYHQGLGHQFAIALESANVVAAAMAVQRDAGRDAPGTGLRTRRRTRGRSRTSPARSIKRPAGRTWASIFLPRR